MSRFHHNMLLTQRSFIALHRPSESKSQSSYQLLQLSDQKSDSSFFRFTPQNMLINPEEIIQAIPMGRMQWYIVCFHFFMFITTSLVIYNYCFLLLDPIYTCFATTAYTCSRE